MMYPRLKLARNLLKDEGVIFISIDDNEIHNIRKVCDEIFGEDNFVCQFIWKRRASSALSDNNVSTDHEYLIAYQKGNLQDFLGYKKDFKSYSNPDNDPRGPWVLGDLTVGMTASMRPNQAYNLVDPNTGYEYPFNPNRVWAYIPPSMKSLIDEKRIYFPTDTSKRPMMKRFQTDLQSDFNPISSVLIDKVGLNTEATKTIQEIFKGNIFDYSKPLSLLKIIIGQVATQKNDIVLDFFAGSGTTADAVMQLNNADHIDRKFICVQLPELIDKISEAFKAGYITIADITKERIRRAGEKIKTEIKEDLFNDNNIVDIGFKAFELDSSNIHAWDGKVEHFEQNIFTSASNIKEGRTDVDLLYEILLKCGLYLTQQIVEKEIAGKKVYNIGLGTLFICLADSINTHVAEGIGQWKVELNPTTCSVIFKDIGLTDVEKTNSIQILKRYGITEVNTI
jgi:adenine-specific DNA-methyltransferase